MATTNTTPAPQTLTGTTSGGTLVGGSGVNTYVVYSPNTIINQADNGTVDTVDAWSSFTMSANIQDAWVLGNNNTLYANNLNNTITVFGPKDTVVTGSGNETLIENNTAGMNIFSFSESSGQDTLQGFNTSGVDHDFIQLSNFGITSFSQVQSDLKQVGANVELTLSPTTSLLIKNTVLSSLTASDFLLQTPTPSSVGQMTFDDEFNAVSLYNPTTGQGIFKTNYWFGTQSGPDEWGSHMTFGNGEQVIFVDPAYQAGAPAPLGLDPFSVSNGILTITASKAPAADLPYLNGQQYISGLLTTEKTFSQTYGYFEMSAELPTGQGLWPAFWLLPTDNSATEIDIMEQIGNGYTNETAHTISATSTTTGFATDFPQYDDGKFHTYGLLWTPQTLTWYVDGVAVASMATPSDMNKPMYLIVSMGVGGNWPGDAPSTFTSASMEVDYLRVYSLANAPVVTATGSAAEGANTFVFAPGSGNQVITDFTTGDHLNLSAYTGDGLKPTLTQVGANVVIQIDASDSITLDNVSLSNLTATATGYDYVASAASSTTATSYTARWNGDAPPAGVDHVSAAMSDSLVGTTAHYLTLTGTANINATANNLGDTLTANSGNDYLSGGAGNDVLISGTGVDTLSGGAGNDTYYVNNAKDSVFGGSGVNSVISTVNWTLGANFQSLTLAGTAAINATGNSGNNVIVGNSAANIINGGGGNDILTGGGGADTFVFGLATGQDVITDWQAGNHIDISAYLNDGVIPSATQSGANVVIQLDAVESITLQNTTLSNLEITSTGFDYVASGGNAATLTAANSNSANAYVARWNGDAPPAGVDHVLAAMSDSLVGTNAHYLTLTGTGNNSATANNLGDTLTANSGNDILSGGTGNDVLISGTGVDTMNGGAGINTYYVNNVKDSVFDGLGTNNVISTVSWTLGANFQNLTLTGTAAINATGNSANNVIVGNSAANVINGGGGNDTLTGGGGADTFVFGLTTGQDVITDWRTGYHMDISAFTQAGYVPTITDQASGEIVHFDSTAQVQLLGVHGLTVAQLV